MADYTITNDANRCVQCGLCVAFCPCNVLEFNEEGYPYAAHPEKCVGCTTCSGNCRKRALLVEATGDATYNPSADEDRAEPISDELHAEYAELQRSIMQNLGLRWQPVAVSLIDKDELLPDVPMPPENLRFCQAMMAARRGASILMPPHRHSCPDGTSIFGMTGVPEKLATGEIYVLFHKVVNAEAAARMVAERPTLPPKSRRATYVAPLAKTVREPEVVVFTGTPEQMMWLSMSMSYYTASPRLPRVGLQLHVRGGGASAVDQRRTQHHVRLLRLPCGDRHRRGHDVYGRADASAADDRAGRGGAGEEGHPRFAQQDLRRAHHVERVRPPAKAGGLLSSTLPREENMALFTLRPALEKGPRADRLVSV